MFENSSLNGMPVIEYLEVLIAKILDRLPRFLVLHGYIERDKVNHRPYRLILRGECGLVLRCEKRDGQRQGRA